ncbi:MAG: bifunctional UDP-N-acetylglucosamine diphosphorylase/glucosamine-1-phosphate N-acetyltransferase GlmU, partial [Candidatus Omnitrophica bacterium]|nr:bifunctional UDP-N-acetylglucosamine diphosphorylase/glucosamine-1-phosphate N-acetyltransferase GlmU [Candidatus Omnitrophota bacterium]
NAGIYCLDVKALFSALDKVKENKAKKEFYLTDIVEIFTQEGLAVETISTENFTETLGVNSRIDLAQSQEVIRRRILDKLMLSGVTVVDPASTHIDADVKIGRDTVIKPLTVIESKVQIGTCCSIGPFARIRSGTKIGNDVEIGNFTEVSRAKIGNATLMKHFGFLGDADLGANVNIGAGTVTANFDGQEKHPTKIGDGAFIGSDAILVAPVKVGKKAVIGAGSVVVRKDIPNGATAVGIPARITKKARSQ